MKVEVCRLLILVIFFVKLSSGVYNPSFVTPRKPHLTPGIKTAGWRNLPSQNILIHHNYSHVNYQHPITSNALTQEQIVERTTQRIYPVYKSDTTQDLRASTAGQEDGTHQKVVIRVKKQLQTYEKCPSGATGSFVYSLSCNQFLNCWKGRGYIQNCAPGTLFNPDTLSCDFPEKVRCITGPRRTIYEQPPPSLSHTLTTRNVQPNCPKDFSGSMPNYSNCSKFVVCMQGQAMNQICPPGTLFDINRNVCDFPKIAKCFNGENQESQKQKVDYFVIGGSNQNSGQYSPSGPYHQTQYSNVGTSTNCDYANGCSRPFGSHPPSRGVSGLPQGSIRPENNNCNLLGSNCNPTTPSYGTSRGNQFFQNTANQQSFGVTQSVNGRVDLPQNTRCDPSVFNCRGQSTPPQRELRRPYNGGQYYQTQYGNTGTYTNCGNPNGCPKLFSSHPPDGGDSGFLQASSRPQTTNCHPSSSNCNSPTSPYGTTKGNPYFTETLNQPNFGGQNNGIQQSVNGKIDSPQSNSCGPSNPYCRGQKAIPLPNNLPSPPEPGLQFDPASGVWIGCSVLTLRCYYPPDRQLVNQVPNVAGEGNIIATPSYNTPKYGISVPISNCNPQDSNCGGRPNRNSQQVYPFQASTIHQPYQGGYNHQNSQGGQSNHFQPSANSNTVASRQKNSSNQPDVRCPPGASGVHPHPYNCSLFLNCANGQTFVMPCGPGTLFNPQMMTCDHDYNVECNYKNVAEPNGNDLRPYTTPRAILRTTSTTEASEEMTTSFTYLRPNPNTVQRGHYITRPPKSQSFHKVSDYEDVGPNSNGASRRFPNQNVDQNLTNDNKREIPKQPTKTWPPPYPATDTNADYVYEYVDVTNESELGATASEDDTDADCTKNGFICNPSRCISKNLVCNGFKDCPDGKDEKNCYEYMNKFDARKNTRLAVLEQERWDNTTATSCAYMCLESKKFDCKSFNYRKIDNCCFLTDKNEGMTGRLMSYEPNDYYELKSSKLDCSNMFKCDNNKCIHKSKICDGQDDCGDREDEKNCKAEDIGYSIKLNGGKKPWEGRIEVSAFGKTGYVCDDKFDMKDADVVCKELGYHLGAAEIKRNSIFAKDVPSDKIFYMMDDVVCLGNETSIKDCDFNGWGSHDCTNEEIVGVVCHGFEDKCPESYWKCKDTNECVPIAFVCDGLEDCSDGSEESREVCSAQVDIRLVNGSNSAEGRVEVLYHDIWGSVCDDDFNDDAAKVVCKSLGYKGTVTVKKEGYFGEGKGPIWLDQVSCFGNESRLEKCIHWKWGEHNCDHSEDVGVICSNSDTSEIERHVQNPQEIKASGATTDPSYPIYPTTCGLRKNSIFTADSTVHFRVVQGSKAKAGEYPWQAAIRVKGKLRMAHWCGAIIISSKFVLTAAHCLVGYPKGAYIVVAGDYNIEEDEGTEQHAYIEDFYIHEDFRKGQKMNNDIALVKLKGSGFKLSQDVQAICLPDEDTDYDTDLNCTISGFGSVESGVSAFSNELRAGKVPLLRKSVCSMPHVYGESLTDGMFCAGYLDGGTDACDGDSGGPLACLDHGLFTLYGITSWGHRCGYANKPGVYVKVAHYRKWIDDIIRKNM